MCFRWGIERRAVDPAQPVRGLPVGIVRSCHRLLPYSEFASGVRIRPRIRKLESDLRFQAKRTVRPGPLGQNDLVRF
jgi:hypothetical protein